MMIVHPEVPSSETEEAKAIYSHQELALLDLHRLPKHVAIIMDGNRRWAKRRGLPLAMGHWEGAEVLTDIVRAAAELGIKALTVYSFSTENWLRPEKEIETLMNVFEHYLVHKKELMVRDGVRLEAIGDLSRLPPRVQEAFFAAKKATEQCDRIQLVLALNYGGRDEIRRAVVKILQDHEQHKLSSDALTEESIARYLDTTRWGDPDLLIRTSGEWRISNFLLWQISYAEFYVTDILWPEFSPKQLLEAVLSYQRRDRRGGE